MLEHLAICSKFSAVLLHLYPLFLLCGMPSLRSFLFVCAYTLYSFLTILFCMLLLSMRTLALDSDAVA